MLRSSCQRHLDYTLAFIRVQFSLFLATISQALYLYCRQLTPVKTAVKRMQVYFSTLFGFR